ncbi:hypothetical protein BD310DRAFT_711795 [Dichomitus squalens]|uniref:Secreted protein n=1 Tax=Dichomitus squalens TaxID=114155 RepID=A0A4Q9PLI8_9APHY|nr:hypothetical protein BD310DRAFT_711795 [Dichomitus squalens]
MAPFFASPIALTHAVALSLRILTCDTHKLPYSSSHPMLPIRPPYPSITRLLRYPRYVPLAIPHILLFHPYVINQCFVHNISLFCHVLVSWSLSYVRFALVDSSKTCYRVGSFARYLSHLFPQSCPALSFSSNHNVICV